MRLYLVRHGIAEDRQNWDGDDDSRPLTAEGRDKMEQVARALRALGVEPTVVATSPLVRARQTAEIVAYVLGWDDPIQEWDALRPEVHPAELQKKLLQLPAKSIVAAFGHEPHMSRAVSFLLSRDADLVGIDFKKAGVCCLDLDRSGAQLVWLAPPAVLRKIKS